MQQQPLQDDGWKIHWYRPNSSRLLLRYGSWREINLGGVDDDKEEDGEEENITLIRLVSELINSK